MDVDRLRHGVAEQKQLFQLQFVARHPGVVRVAAALGDDRRELFQHRAEAVFVVQIELHIHRAAVILRQRLQLAEGRRLRLLRFHKVECPLVEKLDGGGFGVEFFHRVHVLKRVLVVREKRGHAAQEGGGGEQNQLQLADHAQRALTAQKQVDQFHVRAQKVARVLDVRRVKVGQTPPDHAAVRAGQLEIAPPRPLAPAHKFCHPPVGEHRAQRVHMFARAAVEERARPAGVAAGHAADAGRRLGGVGGEKQRPRPHVLQRLAGFLVPRGHVETLVFQRLAHRGQRHARLHAQKEAPRLVAADAEDAVHARKVEDHAPLRAGPAGKARARALRRQRHMVVARKAHRLDKFRLIAGKGDVVRAPHGARFVKEIISVRLRIGLND